MADLEFFFDPVCPWAWITSRWVVEVQQLRRYDVRWRFIALAVINEDRTSDWYTPQYRAGHMAGMMSLRTADAVRLHHDNEAVGRLYTVLGNAIHVDRRRNVLLDDPVAFMEWALAEAGCDPTLAVAANDESHDAYIRADTALAFERAGNDVGTPIITFHPGADKEASFFGPVIARTPRGEDALRLWDAIEVVATTSGMAELKRSNRGEISFD
jgi:2-hydroxychromene-2-carboxylate isomerase